MVRHDYGDVHHVVKILRKRGDSERVIKNVLQFYGVNV